MYASIGETAITKIPVATNQAIMAIVPDAQQISPDFLYFALVHGGKDLATLSIQTTQKNITKGIIENWTIPLPPVNEQRRIVRCLHSVQDAIAARRWEAALERERKAALMHHLFTRGTGGSETATRSTLYGDVPARWPTVLLDECAYIQSGLTPGRRLGDVHTVTRPYLRVANVQDGYLDLSEIKAVAVPVSEIDRYRLRFGDVVLTEGGDADKLGRGVIWRDQVPDCLHQNHIFAVRANRDILLPEYLAYLIQSPYGKAYFLSVAHRTTNLASINSTKLKAFPVILPSLDEQAEIVTALDACDAKIGAVEREIAATEELFRAMLEELMTGRLSALPLAAGW
jgi:type I restriction enzyme S subunit